MPEPKKIPLGESLNLTDQQLDELSQLSAADIERAKAFWRNFAPKKYKTLLDAKPVKEEGEPDAE
jgi:hypothetical protein